MDTDSARLGGHVRARRLALGLTQREAAVKAGIANQTWINVEQGERVKQRTLLRVDQALRWKSGSAEAVLAGGNPDPEPDSPSAVDELQALRGELEALREEVKEMKQGQRS